MQSQLQECIVDDPAHNLRPIPLSADALMQHDHQTAVAVLILPAVQLDVADCLPVEVDDGEEGRAVCDALDAFGDFVVFPGPVRRTSCEAMVAVSASRSASRKARRVRPGLERVANVGVGTLIV